MVGRPRGLKSGGGGGWSEKSPKSRPAVVTVADSKKLRREKRRGMGKRGGMTNTTMKVVDVQQ